MAVILILLVLAGGYYYYLSHRNTPQEEAFKEAKETKVEKMINRDLEKDYPPSPREVVKLYSDILECYYGESYTEDELHLLAGKARQLLDQELLDNNEETEFLKALKDEIAEYKEAKRKIFASYVCSPDEVEYYNYEDEKWAKVKAVYSMRAEDTFFKTYEEYALRQDADGRYKIFGWQLAETDDTQYEE